MTESSIPGRIDEVYECDVLVIGSGVSGYCAAIQAGREGRETILLEKDDVLGGNSGPNLGVGITGADRHNMFATESGVIQELQEEAAWVNGFTPVSPGAMPYNISRRNEAVVQSTLKAAGVRVLKRHFARLPKMDGNRITSVIVEDLAAFRTIEIKVRGVVIEASGDGHVSAQAGADFDTGSEAASEYDERSAPAERRSWIQGTSLVAIAVRTYREVKFIPPPGTPEFKPRLWHGRMATHIEHGHGPFTNPTQNIVFMYMTEAGGNKDTIRDDAEIYEELLGQIWAEWNHIKNGPHAEDAKDWELLWISPKAGKRESRRFLGDVVLTQTDLEEGRRFPDDIAYGGHDLDDHQSLGTAGSNIYGHSIPPLYGIPFRACYSRNIDNVLLAGRLVSATHLAHSSIRVMRTGAAIGHAVGLAAAMCCEKHVTPRALYDNHMDELSRNLLKRDGTILCRAADDPDDLARKASVTASSETRFNDQTPGHMAPMVATAGNLFWDWPERLESVSLYLRNDASEARPMKLSVYRAKREPRWTTAAKYGREKWNDLSDKAFGEVGCQEFELPAGFTGWHTVDFDEPVTLGKKDAAADADRVIISLNEDRNVWWALNTERHEISQMVEHSHHEDYWDALKAMGTMRLSPEVPLGDAANINNGFHRRFTRGPVNAWISKGTAPQDIALTWPEPVTLRRIDVTFDNLVAERHDNPWESARRVLPMMAKEYELSALINGEWVKIAGDDTNIHRFRVHTFDAVTTEAIRLSVKANHGEGGEARVYQIAAFSDVD